MTNKMNALFKKLRKLTTIDYYAHIRAFVRSYCEDFAK